MGLLNFDFIVKFFPEKKELCTEEKKLTLCFGDRECFSSSVANQPYHQQYQQFGVKEVLKGAENTLS